MQLCYYFHFKIIIVQYKIKSGRLLNLNLYIFSNLMSWWEDTNQTNFMGRPPCIITPHNILLTLVNFPQVSGWSLRHFMTFYVRNFHTNIFVGMNCPKKLFDALLLLFKHLQRCHSYATKNEELNLSSYSQN